MRILALTKYGLKAASTRQRFLQYAEPMANSGLELTISPLLGDRHMEALVQGRKSSPVYVGSRYLSRVAALFSAARYDVLWIHCELFPYLPGWFEAFACWVGRRPLVFDYDDAIFHMYDAHTSRLVRQVLGRKLEPLLERAAAATCGNEYLRDYAARFCPKSIVVPTVVDTDLYCPNRRAKDQKLTIGWIGSPSTWKNVRTILPVLQDLCSVGDVRFRVVGAGIQARADQFRGMELAPWSESTEIAEVQGFDIGIMPLIDAPFERGKSGYKLIQYMACGLPSVASPVGVNKSILDDCCGLIAATPTEWREALNLLVSSRGLRERMGAAARQRAIQRYSLGTYAPRLIDLFETLGP